MINAGTVGAYLELDISGFISNLTTAGQLLQQFKMNFDDHFFGVDGLGNAILESLTEPILAAGGAAAEFARVFSGSSETVRSDAASAGDAVSGIAKSIQGATDAAASLYSDKINSAVVSVAESVRGVSAALLENGDSWNVVASEQEGCGERISSSARSSADTVCAVFGGLPETTRTCMLDSWGGMRDELEAGKPALFVAAKSDGDGILDGVDSVLGDSSESGGMRGAGKSAVGFLRKGMEDEKPAAITSITGIMESMVTAAGSVSFTGIGGGIVSGILKGINDKAPTLLIRARNLGTGIAETVRESLHINSPSRVMMEVGRFTAEGMEEGLKQGSRSLYETASAISDETAEALSGISSRGLHYPAVQSNGYGDRLDRLLDAVEKLADSQTTMEIDGRPFGRLVRSAQRS